VVGKDNPDLTTKVILVPGGMEQSSLVNASMRLIIASQVLLGLVDMSRRLLPNMAVLTSSSLVGALLPQTL